MAITNDIFIQFYKTREPFYLLVGSEYVKTKRGHEEVDLCNGFSTMFDECKKRGKFIWINYDLLGTLDQIVEHYDDLPLPEGSGDTYVSASYNVHIIQCYKWALRNPQRKIIVGGPAVSASKIKGKLPPNLVLSEKSLSDFWGVPETGWGIELPDHFQNKVVRFAYPIGRDCYWGKCNFCVVRKENDIKHDCKFMLNLPPGNEYFAFLNTYSISPDFLLKEFPKFELGKDRNRFWTHIRADRQILEVIDSAFKKSIENGLDLGRCWWFAGLEIPSQRMLNSMNKGIVLENYLKLAEIITSYGSKLVVTTLLGWDNLGPEDVYSSRDFFKELSLVTRGNAYISCHFLAIKPEAIINSCAQGKSVEYGPFNFGRIPELSSLQMERNLQILDSMYQAKFRMIKEYITENNLGYDLI